MDTESHLIFGEEICRYFGWSEDYTSWAVAPDIDVGFLHRYHRHRFSTLESLYKEYPKLVNGIPMEDKKIIGTLILSHFYLDIFNAPIFCWGFWLPASNIPPEMTDDLLEIAITKQKDEFYEKSRKCFRNILSHYHDGEEFSGALLNSLRLSTYWLPSFMFLKNLKYFKGFTGYERISLASDERYNSYYFFLKSYFKNI